MLALHLDTPLAVAAVAIPHAAASLLRGWRLRDAIDWTVIRRFGLLSAAGGLAGSVLYSQMGSRALTFILAALLLATSAAGLTGWTKRWTPRGRLVHALGFVSGLFGGAAGNQVGLRAAALLTFGLAPAAFVATSTAIGVLVDLARTPVYVWRMGPEMVRELPLIAAMTVGVLAGTLLGERILLGLSQERFTRLVSLLIGALGLALLVGAL